MSKKTDKSFRITLGNAAMERIEQLAKISGVFTEAVSRDSVDESCKIIQREKDKDVRVWKDKRDFRRFYREHGIIIN